jgi:hypothetical protein
MAIRGSSPVNVNLGMLDTRPAIQANAMVQQANVNLANSVNQAVNNFVQAKEKKENEQISINAIQSLLGISDPNLAKAIVKDPAVGKAFQFQQEQEQIMDIAKLEAAQAPKLSATAEKINLLLQVNPKMTRQEATDLVLGNVSTILDPETGAINLVNKKTGELTTANIKPEIVDKALIDADLVQGSEENSRTLYSMANDTVTGLAPTLFSTAQRLVGGALSGVGADPEIQDPQVIQDQQTLITAQEEIIKTLRASPKVLATEMASLREALDITPGAFMDPTTLQSKMRSIDETMTRRIKQIDEILQRPRYPQRDKGQLRILRQDLRNFQRLLGVPEQVVVNVDPVTDPNDITSIANRYLNIK